MPARLKVLIAEDDLVSRRLLTRSLHDLDYDVISAADGDAALELYRSDPTPIVISDWMMPGQDGLSLCQAIRACGHAEYTHFILLTARVDRESYRQAMAAGVDDFLTKPLNREELAIRLRVSERVVRQRQAANEQIRALARFPEENHNPVLQVDRAGKIVYANRVSRPLLTQWGCQVGDSVPEKLSRLTTVALTPDERAECEISSGSRDFSFTASSAGSEGAAYLYGHDITARKQAERDLLALKQKAEHLALHDGLTGLPNRLFLAQRLLEDLTRCRSTGQRLALLLIDLDYFKSINDTLGHAAGDRLLLLLTRVLREVLSSSDLACRWGGDELVVLLGDLQESSAVPKLCERLSDAFNRAVALSGLTVPVSLSIGSALFPQDATEGEHLLKCADDALYHAKESGRNCWRAYAENANVLGQSELLMRLSGAIDRDEITLHYQPIVDAQSGIPVGLEALVRWQDPIHGWIPPDQFIPLAEDKGLIRRLGQRLTQVGLDQLQKVRGRGAEITLSLNLARDQLKEPEFCENLLRAAESRCLPSSAIILEVTERQSLFDDDGIRHTLDTLAAAGFQLSLDDFGSGYSSLDLIGAIPFHELKIHRGLIQQIETPKARRIVQAVVEMSKALGLTTVAEGVETEPTLRILQDIGVTKIQGYLFARPMSADRIGGYLDRINWQPARGATPVVSSEGDGGLIAF